MTILFFFFSLELFGCSDLRTSYFTLLSCGFIDCFFLLLLVAFSSLESSLSVGDKRSFQVDDADVLDEVELIPSFSPSPPSLTLEYRVNSVACNLQLFPLRR